MGLNVAVFKDVKRTNDDNECKFVAYVVDDNWRYKVKNLEYGARYTGECIYSSIEYAYGTHSKFRAGLLAVIGRMDFMYFDHDRNEHRINFYEFDNEKDIPFHDLICFADNEGCIDWETSKKIYDDFVKYKNLVNKKLIEQVFGDFEYFESLYKNWMTTFKWGSQENSVVDFR